MTRSTNARIAGFTYLFYIAVALPAMILFNRATAAEGTAAKLALIAQHAPEVRLAIVFSLLGSFSAMVLAVTLYGITRDEDHELAMLGLTFRVAEGVTGAIATMPMVGLLRLAMERADANSPDTLGAFVLNTHLGGAGAIFFAAGSTIFCYLLLRGRTIPLALAWLGVLASALLVLLLPAQLVELAEGSVANFMWLPMLVFEVSLALWLIFKGVGTPHTLAINP